MKKTRFLILDSDPINRRELRGLLREFGESADQAFDPSEALNLIRKGRYDCVLVDRDIPQEWHSAIDKLNSPSAPHVFLTGPIGSAPPSASDMGCADGYFPRCHDSMNKLTEYVRRFVAQPGDPLDTQLKASAKNNRDSVPSDPMEWINDPGILIKTSTITNHSPNEDITVITSRGQHKYAVLLGDLASPGELVGYSATYLKSRIRAALEENPAPARTLDEINTELLLTEGSVDFITAVSAFVDLNGKQFTYATAGHLPPIVRRWGRRNWQLLDQGPGIPLGIRNGKPYVNRKLKLVAGDKIFLVSDGILKINGSAGGLHCLNTLIETLNQAPIDAAPQEVIEQVTDTIEALSGKYGAVDEITLILIQV